MSWDWGGAVEGGAAGAATGSMFGGWGTGIGAGLGFLAGGFGKKELYPDYSKVTYPEAPQWTDYQAQLDAYKETLGYQKETGSRLGGTQIARTAGVRGGMSSTVTPQLYASVESELGGQYARALGTAEAEFRQQYSREKRAYDQFMSGLQIHITEAEAVGEKDFLGNLMDIIGMGAQYKSLSNTEKPFKRLAG